MKTEYERRTDYLLSNPIVQSRLGVGNSRMDIESAKKKLLPVFKDIHYSQKMDRHPEIREVYHSSKSDELIMNEAQEIKNARKMVRLDSTSNLFERDTDFIDPRYMEEKYKPIGEWRRYFDVQNFPLGKRRITYRQYSFAGIADVSAPGDGTINYAKSKGKEYANHTHAYNKGYQYTYAELREAMHATTSLDQLEMRAVTRSFETRVQQNMMTGHADVGISGVINHANVPTEGAKAAAGGANAPEFDGGDKTPSEIVADLTGMVSGIITASKKAYGTSGWLIALPITQYLLINNTRMETGTDTSIAQWILKNSKGDDGLPMVKGFLMWPELAGAAPTGSDLAIAYKKDAEYLEAQVNDAVIWHPPQFNDLNIQFPAEMEIGGIVVRHPLSMTQLFNI